MSLKYKLDTLDGLSDEQKELYEKKGDKYVLKVDGVEEGDTVGLKNQVEALLGETKELKKRLKDKDEAETAAREEARRAQEDAAAKRGDVEALRKSADERVQQAIVETEAKYKPTVDKLNSSIRKMLIDNVAIATASKIGLKGSEALLIPHITSRLDVEERNGEFVTVIKDGKGQASALTLADLEKEFQSNAAFAPVIAATQGSGGGAGGTKQKGGGAAGAKTIKRSDFLGLSPEGQAAHVNDGGIVVD